jgi:hypothetical protein
MGTMEVEVGASNRGTTASHGGYLPRRQVSNLSLPKKTSGLWGTSSNLVNSIVGAGIIGIPFALKESGIVAGVMLLLLVAYCTGTSKKENRWHNQVCVHCSRVATGRCSLTLNRCIICLSLFCYTFLIVMYRQISSNRCRIGQLSSQTKKLGCLDL